jgi:hypothetical protein
VHAQDAALTAQLPCLEVAVFRTLNVTDALQRQAGSVFGKYPGYLVGFGLVSPIDADLRMDVVMWASLEQALEAAETFKTDPQLTAYAEAIQKLDVFGHYMPIDEQAFRQLAAAQGAPIIELATYKTLSQAAVEHRRAVHTALASAADLATPHLSLAAVRPDGEQPGMTPAGIDLIGWACRDQAGTRQLVARQPQLQASLNAAQVGNSVTSESFRRI